VLYSNKVLHESSVNGLAFCPHEFGLALAAASSDGKVSILTHQPDNSWLVEYIHDNPLGVNAVSWAPAGGYSDESETPRMVTGGCDNRIRFWVKNLEINKWEEDKSAAVGTSLSHSDWVRDVAWAPPLLPNVNVVASCSEDKKVIIWTQTGGAGNEWKATLLHEFEAPVWRVSWSLTAQMLAVSSGDNDVSLWRAGLDGVWSQMGSVPDTSVEPPNQQ
jgi:protein transport protein SEC13